MMLFDKMDSPNFNGLNTVAAGEACMAWEDWMYSVADSVSEGQWDGLLRIMDDNYNRYFAKYEG